MKNCNYVLVSTVHDKILVYSLKSYAHGESLAVSFINGSRYFDDIMLDDRVRALSNDELIFEWNELTGGYESYSIVELDAS